MTPGAWSSSQEAPTRHRRGLWLAPLLGGVRDHCREPRNDPERWGASRPARQEVWSLGRSLKLGLATP
jgi:hypothetical protein